MTHRRSSNASTPDAPNCPCEAASPDASNAPPIARRIRSTDARVEAYESECSQRAIAWAAWHTSGGLDAVHRARVAPPPAPRGSLYVVLSHLDLSPHPLPLLGDVHASLISVADTAEEAMSLAMGILTRSLVDPRNAADSFGELPGWLAEFGDVEGFLAGHELTLVHIPCPAPYLRRVLRRWMRREVG